MPPFTTDDETTAAEVATPLRSLQIIHLALTGGVAAYLVFLVTQGISFSENDAALPLIPLGGVVVGVVMSFVVPAIMRRTSLAELRGKPKIATESLVGTYQTGHIVGMAILEAAGFLTCFALTGGFGEAPRWFLAVPVALIVLMVIRFPRVAAVVDWVSTAREDLALEESST